MALMHSREYRNNAVSLLSRQFPEADPRIFSAILKNPREDLFPDFAPGDLYGNVRPRGFGGRLAPLLPEVVHVLVESAINRGDQILLVAPRDPYFLVILSELTARIAIFDPDPAMAGILSIAVSDLGVPHIKVTTDTALATGLACGRKVIHLCAPEDPEPFKSFHQNIPPDKFFGYILTHEPSMERF